MYKAQHMKPFIYLNLFLVCLFLIALQPCSAAETKTRTIEFQTDGKAQEQKYLFKENSRNYVLEGVGKPARNLDGKDRFVVWRFDMTGVTRAKVQVHLLNSYALSVSSNGKTFREISRQVAGGGSNAGWKTADLTPLLPTRYAYVKVEHGDKKQGGFGACIFQVRVELEVEPIVPVGQDKEPGASPSVSLSFLQPGSLGKHPATLHCAGSVDAARHELSLDVVPVESSAIPASQQDLSQMNPIFQTVKWPQDTKNQNTVKTTYMLDRFGDALLVATLRERQTGKILSRAVQSVSVTREQVEPIKFSLRQPFVSTEATLPALVRLNLREERLPGARSVATLTDLSGKQLHIEETKATKEPIQLVFPVASLAAGEYRISVNIEGKNGQSLAKADRRFTKYVPTGKPRAVSINQDGVCMVNGKPMMPLGFMLGGATPEAVAAGYNVGMWACEYPKDPADLAGTDRAEAAGGMVVLHVCNYLRGKNDIEGLRARVSRLKNEPGLLAWYLADEPEGCGDTPELLRKAYLAIKEIDPNHPVCICTNVPGMLQKYRGCADVIGADPYPIPDHDLTLVADWTEAAVTAAKKNGQAVWMTPQGFGFKEIGLGVGRAPTDDEFTCMLATCFIHGAKGILWWPYGPPRTHHWEHFQWMGRISRLMEPWVLHGSNVERMPSGAQRADGVHWRIWQHDQRLLLLASNLKKVPKTLSLRIPSQVTTIVLPMQKNSNGLPESKALPTNGVLDIELKPLQTVIAVLGLKD